MYEAVLGSVTLMDLVPCLRCRHVNRQPHGSIALLINERLWLRTIEFYSEPFCQLVIQALEKWQMINAEQTVELVQRIVEKQKNGRLLAKKFTQRDWVLADMLGLHTLSAYANVHNLIISVTYPVE